MERLEELHKRCFNNGEHISPDTPCGCFYCGTMLRGEQITDWIRSKGENTARCPRCGVDSVLYADEEVQITEELLRDMHARWF